MKGSARTLLGVMPETHSVSVERQRLRFAAGHFATFADELEPIHGHNYDVMVEVQGPLTDESWVVDFSLLKRLTREVCETLDHKFLLQMDSGVLSIAQDGEHYVIQYKDELPYRLPKHDVAALPIDNTPVGSRRSSAPPRPPAWSSSASAWRRCRARRAGSRPPFSERRCSVSSANARAIFRARRAAPTRRRPGGARRRPQALRQRNVRPHRDRGPSAACRPAGARSP